MTEPKLYTLLTLHLEKGGELHAKILDMAQAHNTTPAKLAEQVLQRAMLPEREGE